jgi:hypothetical protein
VERELYTHQGSGVLTYFWATEYASDGTTGNTTFRFYADSNEPLEFTLDFLGGIGFDDDTVPWGHSYFGKAATTGAVYSTLRVPFRKVIRITGELPKNQNSSVLFWWITRGVDNLGVNIGGYTLPDTAVLKLYKNVDVQLKPLEFLDLVNSTNNGAVWMVTLAARSANLNYLEGCVRMYTGPKQELSLLSSGTEDYFQSAYYFNAGAFHFPEAGLTHDAADGTLSAYKVHERDALFFQSGGFAIVWRNGDMSSTTTGEKCVYNGGINGDPQPSVVTSYVWVYEW